MLNTSAQATLATDNTTRTIAQRRNIIRSPEKNVVVPERAPPLRMAVWFAQRCLGMVPVAEVDTSPSLATPANRVNPVPISWGAALAGSILKLRPVRSIKISTFAPEPTTIDLACLAIGETAVYLPRTAVNSPQSCPDTKARAANGSTRSCFLAPCRASKTGPFLVAMWHRRGTWPNCVLLRKTKPFVTHCTKGFVMWSRPGSNRQPPGCKPVLSQLSYGPNDGWPLRSGPTIRWVSHQSVYTARGRIAHQPEAREGCATSLLACASG